MESGGNREGEFKDDIADSDWATRWSVEMFLDVGNTGGGE